MSFLVISEILALFVNILSAYYEGCLYIDPFKCKYLRDKKHFLKCFLPFLKQTYKFEHFEKNLTLIADIFPK